MSDLPQAMNTGTVWIGGHAIVVHVLDNGERVIEQESFEKLLAWFADGRMLDEETAMELARLIKGVGKP